MQWTCAGSRAPPRAMGGLLLHSLRPTPYTLHPAHYALCPKPYTLHPTHFTLHPSCCTLQTTPCTLHPTSYTLHPAPYTPHPSPYTLHPTPYTLHRNMQWFRGGLVFKAHRLSYHSPLGLRVMKKKGWGHHFLGVVVLIAVARLRFQAGSNFRLIDCCITQLKAQRPSRTWNESKEEEEEASLWREVLSVARTLELWSWHLRTSRSRGVVGTILG